MTSDTAGSSSGGGTTSNNVYIRDEEHGWIPGRVISSSGGDDGGKTKLQTATVVASFPSNDCGQSTMEEREIVVKLNEYPQKSLPLQNVDENGHLIVVDDMVDLSFLHEAAILYNLKHRHANSIPYTRTGDIVIAVNPYQWLKHLYSTDTQSQYAQTLIWNPPSSSSSNANADPKSLVDPHVYETSSLAYRGLACDGQNQSILVSGESGAGKTETVKILMSHLAMVQGGGTVAANEDPSSGSGSDGHNDIIRRVLDSNPLLEAFGNAKTSRNDNSSRFGKFIQLQFDAEDPYEAGLRGKRIPSACLAGSKCVTYLLEKSRVVLNESTSERGYHIFYQLLAAPDSYKCKLHSTLTGTTPASFRYLGPTNTTSIEGKTDGERFQLTCEALKTIGIDDDTLFMLMKSMVVVLQLGQLIFDKDPTNEENSTITSPDELNDLADIMGMCVDDIRMALTNRTVTARNDTYKVPLNDVAAKDCCDAFAKEIYSKMFDWLVTKINQATSAELNYHPSPTNDGTKPAKNKYKLIGLLDIFGFESFEVNRFEQLCINYANEKLQQKFTQDIFRSVQAEYEFEGIELGEVAFEDNADVLKLIEGRMGIISVLNEECVRPRGNDISFVAKVTTMNKESEDLIKNKRYRDYQFGIQHYAGPVTYDATNFVKKNMDNLPQDLKECAKKCSIRLIQEELVREPAASESSPPSSSSGPPAANRKAAGYRRQGSSSLVASTVATKFRTQLTTLMHNIGETRTRYIRCIKPNQQKQPQQMHHNSTMAQLRCAGVVAAVTISRSAFPNRLEHSTTLERFACLSTQRAPSTADTKTQVDVALTQLLKSLEKSSSEGTVQKAFVCGKTRVYFRAGSLEYLEAQRMSALADKAVVLQSQIRMYFCRKWYQDTLESIILVQSMIRCRSKRTIYVNILYSTIVTQCWYRCQRARQQLRVLQRIHAAVKIQTLQRTVVQQRKLKRFRASAICVQCMVRGALQRPKYRIALQEAQEEAKLENQLKTLQRKLEEAEKRRVEAEKRAQEAAASGGTTTTKETVVVYRDRTDSTASSTAAEEKKSNDAAAAAGRKAPAAVAVATPTAEQQALMDESGKMLDYLRKEVFKLRTQNAQLRKDFDLVRDNNQRLMESNASAGASFAALNQHAKQLNKTNSRLMGDLMNQKQLVSKLHLAQMELKEELKMKQSTYVQEVQSRLLYQKTMQRMVQAVRQRCAGRDDALVDDITAMAASCEADYMKTPAGGGGGGGTSNTPFGARTSSNTTGRGLMSGMLAKAFSPEPSNNHSSMMMNTPMRRQMQQQNGGGPNMMTPQQPVEEEGLTSRFKSFLGMGSASANANRTPAPASNPTSPARKLTELSGMDIFGSGGGGS